MDCKWTFVRIGRHHDKGVRENTDDVTWTEERFCIPALYCVCLGCVSDLKMPCFFKKFFCAARKKKSKQTRKTMVILIIVIIIIIIRIFLLIRGKKFNITKK